MALAVTTTQTTELVIEPRLKRQLLLRLKTYQALKGQIDALTAKMDAEKAAVAVIREQVGEDKLACDGYKVSRIQGTYEVLDKKKLVELGCAMAWIQEATELRPKKEHIRISCPGERTHDA